ncbi:bifunctional 2-C-methyl-D-erythritol 4-phosphate cytidylyltransferase/2-C-methyl-D-erythritol 2,4-cyclodiphosphate synthase [Sulfuricurvum sp.]|uniref:bifunctional 2-C-methyl-D-erythritol 4-phosphate cytidylyltransferase/2-C-methyl-D-erythritol 2,4-cyclodiphosphate synthase n=1 Tax=Sulfuricurvum sp. TaxID=2025608 RepID=UPI002E306299|nr:bifunctional 2-C-methyl-D-erythritol 4-phosphate cytidylyltransferase/2-C-methyl-D-erythritol 2,4-cyclodiphosphate synthase [Sulfuricurvum sp.]HEX5329563.1 bifunctional 2-C-methyl-D-erythritol 4-phosphate cytidylyltransferase/2-C-methyl-D-erythritol 2,4-cyclodiphosphate synthase [Sulfuricurvum sp.]
MSDLTLVLLAAGNSERFKVPVKKQWLRIGHDPLWFYVTNRIKSSLPDVTVILVAHADEIPFMTPLCDFSVVSGGATRQQSLKNALKEVKTPYVMVSDIARACVDPDLIVRLLEQKGSADTIVPALDVHDTVVYHNETITREHVKRIQTPQLSRSDVLRRALESDVEYTDESSAVVACGGTRRFVLGDEKAAKITHAGDTAALACLGAPANVVFTGNGFDVHPFEEGKPMVLGGVEIESPFGFKAHSDGDVAIHALIDALLGAACLGDIGMLFPDTDASYKNIDSKLLLERCVQKLHNFGFVILHADVTIIAQEPKIAPYKDSMRQTLASIMLIPASRVNVKATTTEHLGFIGRKEGLGVIATASVHYFDWKNG